jgi:hypothetical protein
VKPFGAVFEDHHQIVVELVRANLGRDAISGHDRYARSLAGDRAGTADRFTCMIRPVTADDDFAQGAHSGRACRLAALECHQIKLGNHSLRSRRALTADEQVRRACL